MQCRFCLFARSYVVSQVLEVRKLGEFVSGGHVNTYYSGLDKRVVVKYVSKNIEVSFTWQKS